MQEDTFEEEPKIKVGDYIIIQRQKYTKLHKFGNLESTAALGKEQLILRNIDGHKYFSTFKIIPKETTDGGRRKQRSCNLEICTETDIRSIREKLNIQESGTDNRNIIDDSQSQGLKTEDIFKLKDTCSDSSQILEKIVENSKTFQLKTEYSQDKYLKKKEKKYFEYVQIRQPTIRLLVDIFYRQDLDKIMGIRIDILSQILSYANISGFGNYLLYESGTNGIIPAAILNSMGRNTKAKMVHMHPGNVCQKQAVLALNLPEEQLNRCISVNIYSVLRDYYQNTIEELDENKQSNNLTIEVHLGEKRKLDEIDSETNMKKLKTDSINLNENKISNDKQCEEINQKLNQKNEREKTESKNEIMGNLNNQLQKWQIENKRAGEIIKEQFDALIIIAKEHPNNIIKELLPFLKPSRPIVIYNQSKEILQELYVDLKSTSDVTGLHLISNWLRMMQILPNRTHPEVSMNGNGGYLLYGYSIR